MMPSFTVPKRVPAPTNEFRVEKPEHEALPVSTFAPPFAPQSGLSKLSALSICQMNLMPAPAMLRSPRKPRYEFCTSIARRGPGVIPAQPPVAPLVPQMPLVDTRVDTDVPGVLASLLVPYITCG